MVERLFGCFDKDANGLIDRTEFAAVVSSLCGGDERAKCRVVFDLYDADGDGSVTKPELENILRAYFGSRAAVIEELVVCDLEDEAGAAGPPQSAGTGIEAQGIIDDFVAAVFGAADTNDDSLLSFDELQAWLCKDTESSKIYGNEMVKWIDILVTGLGK